MAIQEALTHLDTSVHHDINIFIFSDSQAALRALDSYTTNLKTISECRQSLNEMATHLRINLIWVPGHRNIEGNCIAVELPRQGTTADILRDKDTVGMPMATCKLHLRQRLTHFPTTVGTQSQHATTPDSHGQTTTRKEQKLSYNVAGRTSPLS